MVIWVALDFLSARTSLTNLLRSHSSTRWLILQNWMFFLNQSVLTVVCENLKQVCGFWHTQTNPADPFQSPRDHLSDVWSKALAGIFCIVLLPHNKCMKVRFMYEEGKSNDCYTDNDSFTRHFYPHWADEAYAFLLKASLSSPSVKHSPSPCFIRYSDLVTKQLTAPWIRMEREGLKRQTVSGSSNIAGVFWGDISWCLGSNWLKQPSAFCLKQPLSLLPTDPASVLTCPIEYIPEC